MFVITKFHGKNKDEKDINSKNLKKAGAHYRFVQGAVCFTFF